MGWIASQSGETLTPIPSEVLKIVRCLRDAGFEAVLVGGFVRDMLLGREAKDCDVATSARPEQVASLFPRSHPVGAQFGVMLVVVDDTEVEVATFRSESDYADGRRPSNVEFSNLDADAARRDFTINALYYDPIREELIDPLGGRVDLDAKLIRTVGNPYDRFQEDHLRLLRAVRLAAVLDFKMVPDTFSAVQENAELVQKVSAERVRNELTLCLLHPRRADAFRLMDEAGLLKYLLPELIACKGVEQPPQYHPEGDVYVHTLGTLEHLGPNPSPTLAWALLLHDLGKPPTATHVGGRNQFRNHEVVGAEMAQEIATRLRMSRADKERITWLVHHHMVFLQVAKMRRSTLRRYLAHPGFAELHGLHKADRLGGNGDLTTWEIVEEARLGFVEQPAHPPPLVTGQDLIDLGIEPGPIFTKILGEVETAQLEDEVSTREEALTLMRSLAGQHGLTLR